MILIPFQSPFICQAPLFYPTKLACKQDPCLQGREEKNRPFPGKPVCRRTAPVYRNLGRQRRKSRRCRQKRDPAQDPLLYKNSIVHSSLFHIKACAFHICVKGNGKHDFSVFIGRQDHHCGIRGSRIPVCDPPDLDLVEILELSFIL